MKNIGKNQELLILEKKLLKTNKKEIFCKVNLVCIYILIVSSSIDLTIDIISFNINTIDLIGFVIIMVISVCVARKVVEYRKKNRNQILKSYISNSFHIE